MKCIVCHQGILEVVNSRKHRSEPSVWRRRKCGQCGTIFTTKELPDYDRAFYITYGKKESDCMPFEKSALLAQLFAAGGHVKKQQDLFYLAETIAARAFQKAAESAFTISNVDYRSIVSNTLEAYDKLLSANFEARNPS